MVLYKITSERMGTLEKHIPQLSVIRNLNANKNNVIAKNAHGTYLLICMTLELLYLS